MKNKEVENVLQALIAYLRDVADFMEAVQTRIEEGFTTEDKTEYNNDSYEILKNILEEAKVEDLSMQDNISFMLGSIHKRIGKYKHVIKEASDK